MCTGTGRLTEWRPFITLRAAADAVHPIDQRFDRVFSEMQRFGADMI
jgi:hypothetical protein